MEQIFFLQIMMKLAINLHLLVSDFFRFDVPTTQKSDGIVTQSKFCLLSHFDETTIINLEDNFN